MLSSIDQHLILYCNWYYTALGAFSGTLIYSSLVVFFLPFMDHEKTHFIDIISIFGGLILFYMAYQCLKSKPYSQISSRTESEVKVSKIKMWVSGFLVDLSNPKSIVYFLSILPVFAQKHYGFKYQILEETVIASAVILWLLFLASIVGIPSLRNFLSKHFHVIDRIFGGLLCLISVFLFYSVLKHFKIL